MKVFRIYPRPALFHSVRSSRDHALVAFVAALLAAFVVHAGAFAPRLAAPEPEPRAADAPRCPSVPVVAGQAAPAESPPERSTRS